MHPIIQEYLDAGYIDKTAAARLMRFEEDLIKEAGFWDKVVTLAKNTFKSSLPTIKEKAPVMGLTLAGGLGVAGISNYLKNRERKQHFEAENANVVNSYHNMMSTMPELARKVPMATERFNEIASISPTLASNPIVAGKLVKKTLTKGLSENEMSTLYQIESNARSIKTFTPPVSGVRKTFDDVVTPVITNTLKNVGEGIGKSWAEQKSPEELQEAGNKLLAERRDELETYMIKDIMSGIRKGYTLPPGKNSDLVESAVKIGPYSGERLLRVYLKSNGIAPQQALSYMAETGINKGASILGLQYALLEKVASQNKLSSALGPLMKGVLGAGLAGVAGLGFGVVNELAEKKQTDILNRRIEASWSNVTKRLKELTDENSTLVRGIDYSDKDTQKKAKEAFNMLVSVAPSLAAEPVIASSFVNTAVLNDGDVDPNTLKVITDTQKNIRANEEYRSPFSASPLVRGFESGFNMGGGREFVGAIAKNVAPK